MSFGLGRIAYPLAIFVVVGSTWCLAWARSVSDESARAYWPARDPQLMQRLIAAERSADAPDFNHSDRATHQPVDDRIPDRLDQ